MLVGQKHDIILSCLIYPWDEMNAVFDESIFLAQWSNYFDFLLSFLPSSLPSGDG